MKSKIPNPKSAIENSALPTPHSAFLFALARLEWLLLLTSLVLVILVYPLRLQDAWLGAFIRTWNQSDSWWSHWSRDQFESYLSFFHSPLLLKGILAGVAMIAFMVIRLVRLLLGPVLSPQATPSPAQGRWAWLSVAAFFLWLIVSAEWSPTPALAGEVVIWALMYGLFIFLLLRRGLSLAELTRVGALLMLLGAVVIAVCYLEALPIFKGKIFLFLNRFADSAMRNIYGSLLGHNTAAASFLMMTAFPAFAFLFSARALRRRLLVGLYLAALLFAILILQSRAIWVLFPVLLLLAMRSALRGSAAGRLRRLPTIVLAAASLSLATQVIDRPWNPLFIRDNPFARRIKAISPEGLAGEARLRLNIIGATLVPDAPLIGHGLYAFQYVYPKRQGEYFLAHPNSRLNQTTLRSHMAHNEYLQALIDQGAIGLGLMIWMLVEIARRGWRRRKDMTGPARLLHEAFGWSALGFTLHALVDFPYHIPQLALPGIFCLAAWGACRPCRTREMPQESSESAPSRLADRPASPFRLVPFLRLLLALMLLLLIPPASLPLAIAMQVDIRYSQANAYMESFYSYSGMTPREKSETLQSAIRCYQDVVRRLPSQYLAWQRLSEAFWLLGRLWAEQISAPDSADRRAEADKAEALRLFNQGLKAADRAHEGLDYHSIYILRAEIYREINELVPGPEFRRQYRLNLERTLRYCPAYVQAAYELAEMLAAGPNPDRGRILKLRKQVLKHDPYYFGRQYVSRAYQYFRDKRYHAAAASWEAILPCDPERTEWIIMTAQANMMVGQRERALELVKKLRARAGKDNIEFYSSGGSIVEAAIGKQWDQLRVELVNLLPRSSTDLKGGASSRVMELEIGRRLDRRGAEDFFLPPATLTAGAWERLLAETRPEVLLHTFADPAAARKALDERLAMPGEAPAIDFWLEGVYIGLAANDKEMAGRSCEEVRKLNPAHPALPDLRALINARRSPPRNPP